VPLDVKNRGRISNDVKYTLIIESNMTAYAEWYVHARLQ